jgi:hypothetical protein
MTTKQKLEALIDASLEGNLPASFTEAMDRRIREMYAVLVADDWELGEEE